MASKGSRKSAAELRGGTARREASGAPSLPSPPVRSAVTVALVLHLAAVALGVSVVYRPSPLQQRLLGVFAPYLRPLHLAVDTQPLYLTHGEPHDQPHRVEVRGSGENEAWQPIRPEGLPRFSARRARFQRWAQVAGMLARAEQTSEVADLAAAASRYWRAHSGDLPTGIRVVRDARLSETLVFPPPIETVEEYVADVFIGGASSYPEVARRSEAVEMAPPLRHAGGEGAGSAAVGDSIAPVRDAVGEEVAE